MITLPFSWLDLAQFVGYSCVFSLIAIALRMTWMAIKKPSHPEVEVEYTDWLEKLDEQEEWR